MRWWSRRRNEDGHLPLRSSRAADARDERLSAYLDDDLPPEDRAALDAELTRDDALRDALAGMRAVSAALGTLEPVRAPRPFTLQAAPAASGRPRILDFGLQLGAAVSALLLVVAIIDPGDSASFSASTPLELTRATSAADAGTAGADDGGAQLTAPAAATGDTGDGGAAASEPVAADSGGAIESAPAPAAPTTEALTTEGPTGSASADRTATAPGETAPPSPATGSAAGSGVEGGNAGPAATPGALDAATPPTTSAGDSSAAPAPGTGEADLTSQITDGRADDRSLVPALAVLTALLAALVALRWSQSRRIA